MTEEQKLFFAYGFLYAKALDLKESGMFADLSIPQVIALMIPGDENKGEICMTEKTTNQTSRTEEQYDCIAKHVCIRGLTVTAEGDKIAVFKEGCVYVRRDKGDQVFFVDANGVQVHLPLLIREEHFLNDPEPDEAGDAHAV